MREAFERSTRAGRNDFFTVLEAVRNEPIGALIFSTDEGQVGFKGHMSRWRPTILSGLRKRRVRPP